MSLDVVYSRCGLVSVLGRFFGKRIVKSSFAGRISGIFFICFFVYGRGYLVYCFFNKMIGR